MTNQDTSAVAVALAGAALLMSGPLLGPTRPFQYEPLPERERRERDRSSRRPAKRGRKR